MPTIYRNKIKTRPKRRLHNWEWLSPRKGSYSPPEEKSGVYIIYAYLDRHFQSKQIVYIGKAEKLNKRVLPHPLKKFLHGNDVMTCCKVKYCESPGILETSLIKKLKPIFNMQHNKAFVKKVYMDYMLNELHQKIKKNTAEIEGE